MKFEPISQRGPADRPDPDDPDGMPPLPAAHAYWGLALNQNLYVGDRLDCALNALKHYDQWRTELQKAVEDRLDRSDDRSFGYLVGLRCALDLITGEGEMTDEDD